MTSTQKNEIFKKFQIFRLDLAVTDGRHLVKTPLTFSVLDVQNSPPRFEGSLTGIVAEDAPIGAEVLR